MSTKSPLRILHFISYPQKMGGANRSLFELVTHYPPTVQPHIVTTADTPVVESYRLAGIPVTVVPAGPRLTTYGRAALKWSTLEQIDVLAREAIPLGVRLAKIIHENRIDIVHANDPRGALQIGPAARMLGVPFIAHLHGERSFDGLVWSAYERLSQKFISVSDNNHACLSPRARKRAVTVHNGMPDIAAPGPVIPWLQSARQAGEVVVAAFASLLPFKGCHHLLDAAALLKSQGFHRKLKFLWIGDHPKEYATYVQWVQAKQQAMGLDNFTFAGWQLDPLRFYRSIDLAVLPSVSRESLDMDGTTVEIRGNEGLPMTHIEAMCYSLPIVGTRISGVPEIVAHGKTGLLVDPGNPTQLADAIETLARDPHLRARYGAAGRQRALEKFSVRAQVQGVLRVLDEMLPGRVYAGSTVGDFGRSSEAEPNGKRARA